MRGILPYKGLPCSADRSTVPALPPTRNADVGRPGPGSARPGASATSENHPGSPQYRAVITGPCREPSLRSQGLSGPSNSELDRWAPKPPAGHPDGRKELRLLKIIAKTQKQKPMPAGNTQVTGQHSETLYAPSAFSANTKVLRPSTL